MAKKGGGGAPPSPDPVATAAAQAAANKETAIAQAQLNMINQVGPTGTLTYKQTGEGPDKTPTFTATTTLSPEQQALFDKENAIYGTSLDTGQTLLNNVQGALGEPLDLSSLGEAPRFDDAYRKSVADAMYARQSPAIEQDRQALDARLAAQGVTLGSEAYDRAQAGFGKNLNDLRLGIDASAGSEASRAYAAALQGRNQGINELTLQRNQPINELTGLLGLGQVQAPNFGSPPQTGIANTDVIGPTYASYQGQLNNYNQRQASSGGLLGGLFGLGGAALGGWGSAGFPAFWR